MIAYRGKEELLKTGDFTVPAVKVKVTLPGLLSIFWSMDYWYNYNDGTIIKIEGKSKGPGSMDSLTELIKIEKEN